MRLRRTLISACIGVACPLSAPAAEFLVHSAAQINAAQASAMPGDVIVMADGVWSNQSITFSDTGTAANPITLRAQTPGRVILTGTSRLTISGEHLIVDGLVFRDGTLTSGNIVSFTSSSSFSRWTNSAIIDYDAAVADGYHWIHVDGQENRVDHNFIRGHKNDGVTLEVSPAIASKHRIDSNHFVDRPAGSDNGFETIRLGVSGIQARSAQALVESNLFERVDGELEIISNKTSNNIIRNNTIRASAGTITLRHGQGSTVQGNFILGENKSGTGGIRVIGPNHAVLNNYMADLDTNALSITTGYNDWDVVATATGYEPVYNVLIAHNTAVNVTDQILTRDAGYSSGTNRVVRPRDVIMANNLLYNSSETMVQGTEGANWTWAGNILNNAPSLGKSGAGVLNVDPKLAKDPAGLWRPAANSPAINAAATGTWTPPPTDIDGQSRLAPLDVGADEVTAAGPITNHPLYGADVGPSWLKRRTAANPLSPVPVLLFEAEDFTALSDPNADGATWTVVPSPTASGGKILKAPAGPRTDVTPTSGTHDAIAEWDLAIHDPGTWWLYVLARGLDSGSNSLYSPSTITANPTTSETLSETGQWRWEELASYTITPADVNKILTLKLARRERDTEIDRLILSPTRLTLPIPEPTAILAISIVAGACLYRRSPYKRSSR